MFCILHTSFELIQNSSGQEICFLILLSPCQDSEYNLQIQAWWKHVSFSSPLQTKNLKHSDSQSTFKCSILFDLYNNVLRLFPPLHYEESKSRKLVSLAQYQPQKLTWNLDPHTQSGGLDSYKFPTLGSQDFVPGTSLKISFPATKWQIQSGSNSLRQEEDWSVIRYKTSDCLHLGSSFLKGSMAEYSPSKRKKKKSTW